MSKSVSGLLLGLLLFGILQTPAWGESETRGERFKIARPGYNFSFPKDHGAHPNYEIEWWYFTGNLQSKKGQAYGYELTFFRKGIQNNRANQNPSRWVVQDIYLAHFAITDIPGKIFHYEEKVSRKAMGKAGAKQGKMSVWIDHWQALQDKNGTIHLKSKEEAWGLDLSLRPLKPIVIHGEDGVSRKGASESASSHYYSITRLETIGSLSVAGDVFEVTGLSWMDHEFTSTLLDKGLIGWDWFSIQLENGSDYMIYQLRRSGGTKDPSSSGTVIDSQGKTRHLNAKDFLLTPLRYWKSPKSGANYPLAWQLSLPSEGLFLKSEPELEDQELITSNSTGISYWEGASHFKGSLRGVKITGKGYVELTGYAEDLKPSRLEEMP